MSRTLGEMNDWHDNKSFFLGRWVSISSIGSSMNLRDGESDIATLLIITISEELDELSGELVFGGHIDKDFG